jgi:hypothetical protein
VSAVKEFEREKNNKDNAETPSSRRNAEKRKANPRVKRKGIATLDRKSPPSENEGGAPSSSKSRQCNREN